jgi:membrane associated rhomboid family serine protease
LASGIVAGSVATVIMEPPNVPMIGASGGIWALAAYDLIRYPRSRMMLFLGFRPMSGVLVIPSILFFILYLFLNLLGGLGVVAHGRVAIAYFGHLGGIGAGLLFYFLMPKVRRKF